MTNTITITEKISDLHDHELMSRKLWLTPGSSCPYWANNARFTYDECVAIPQDFLEAVGYDCFDEEADYEENDEAVTLVVELIPFLLIA